MGALLGNTNASRLKKAMMPQTGRDECCWGWRKRRNMPDRTGISTICAPRTCEWISLQRVLSQIDRAAWKPVVKAHLLDTRSDHVKLPGVVLPLYKRNRLLGPSLCVLVFYLTFLIIFCPG